MRKSIERLFRNGIHNQSFGFLWWQIVAPSCYLFWALNLFGIPQDPAFLFCSDSDGVLKSNVESSLPQPCIEFQIILRDCLGINLYVHVNYVP